MKKMKLSLNKETIAKLNAEELQNINGGEEGTFSLLCLLTKPCFTLQRSVCPQLCDQSKTPECFA